MFRELSSDMRYRLRALFSRDALEQELSDELRFHIEREAEKYERQGVSRDAALRRAYIGFGGVERAKEVSRDGRGTAWLESVVRDLRYAVRSLRARPVFALTVIATLTLGIGANTAIFTLVDALMLRPLPVSHPEQLVIVSNPAEVNSGWSGSPKTDYVSMPLFEDVRARNAVFSDMYANGADLGIDVTIGGTDASVEHPRARFVTGNYFSVLGVPAYAGRTFSTGEDKTPGDDPIAVITYDYWQRRFSGSSAAIGTVMHVNNVAITIVGVTPPGFGGDIIGQPCDFWLPMMMQPAIHPSMSLLKDRGWSWVVMMGRLKPGVTLEQARHEIAAIEANAIREHLSGIELARFEQDLKDTPIHVEPGARGFSERRAAYGKALWMLMAAVVLVILVACTNVSSLMLARTIARGHEMSLRLVLGAGRGRLIQQLLIESGVLAIVSSVLGFAAAGWGTRVLLTTVSAASPIVVDAAADARVLAVTAAMTVASVLIFGLLPAFRGTQVDLAASLRAQGRIRRDAARLGRIPLGRVLVIAQIALSMLLLIGGGLLVRSMQQLVHADLGFDRDHIVTVDVRMRRSPYAGARLSAFRRDVAEHVRRVPGVDAAAFAQHGVFSGGHSSDEVDVSGFTPQADSERHVALDFVGPNFFHAIGAHLLRGRDIDARDIRDAGGAAVINETAAKHYFGMRNPLGAIVTSDSAPYLIVGVVRDFQASGVRDKPQRMIWFASNSPDPTPRSFELDVHVVGDPSRFIGPIRQAIQSVDRTIPLTLETLNGRVRGTVSQDVLLVQATMFFCLVTLVLAALGLYGVTAYSASQRTSEFGLRAALGAEPGQVARLVLGEGVRLAIGGIVIGVPTGLLAARLIRSELFGISPVDLPSLAGAIVILVGTAVLASYLPARRAAKVGPLEALRVE